ncbi:MAG: ComEC/Rec2 family competence protein [Rubrobacteraceae bacterium]
MDRPPNPRRPGIREAQRAPVRVAHALILVSLLLLAVSCGFANAGTSSPPAGALAVSFIDVGQGDATLVQSGGENYLIDAGRPEAGPEVVDFLRSRGVRELDGLVATHPDADHIGGLPDVLDAFPVSTVYLSGEDDKGTTTFNTFLRAVQDEGAQTLLARAGMQEDWGGTQVTVLSPPPDSEGGLFGESNEDSVSMLLVFGTARILLTGDAENRGEEYMSTGRFAGPLTVLKVGHHGSNTSTTPLFLNRFRPEVAVIAVGENSYGHPTPQTLRRLKTVGAEVFRTDEDGDVIVTIKDEKIDVAVTQY